jgi:hypothetical protein
MYSVGPFFYLLLALFLRGKGHIKKRFRFLMEF